MGDLDCVQPQGIFLVFYLSKPEIHENKTTQQLEYPFIEEDSLIVFVLFVHTGKPYIEKSFQVFEAWFQAI